MSVHRYCILFTVSYILTESFCCTGKSRLIQAVHAGFWTEQQGALVPSFQAAVNAMEEELCDGLHAQHSSLLSTHSLLDSAELSRLGLLDYAEGSQGCSGVALVNSSGADVGLLATALARRMVQSDK